MNIEFLFITTVLPGKYWYYRISDDHFHENGVML